MLERVCEIVADITQNALADINENSTSSNTDGWDAAAQISIIATIELDFGVTIDPQEAESLNSVRKLMHVLKMQMAA
jgi:acyl carrier protein